MTLFPGEIGRGFARYVKVWNQARFEILSQSFYFNSLHNYFHHFLCELSGTQWMHSRRDCVKVCSIYPHFNYLSVVLSLNSWWEIREAVGACSIITDAVGQYTIWNTLCEAYWTLTLGHEWQDLYFPRRATTSNWLQDYSNNIKKGSLNCPQHTSMKQERKL